MCYNHAVYLWTYAIFLQKRHCVCEKDKIISLFPDNAMYFPAYEIVLDELRDYRFYADDMVHPSPVAVEYIWECFGKCYFDTETQKLNEEIETVVRAIAHKPFDAASDGYKNFLCNLLKKIEKVY